MTKNYYLVDTRTIAGLTMSAKKELKTKNQSWFFALSMFLFLISFNSFYAQSTANYAFSTNTTSSLALDANNNAIDMTTGTTSLVAAGSDQGVSPITNIGFNYIFYGNSFSQFSVSANGILQLGPTAVSGSTYVSSGGTTTAPKFSALGSDAITASIADGGGVISKVIGSAPNRVLVIQWTSYLWWTGNPAPTNPSTFQVRLYETTGVVEYVYGAMPVVTGFTGSTGFSAGTLINQVASIVTSTNTVSYNVPFAANVYPANTNITNLHSTSNGSRRGYVFTPPNTVLGDVTNLTFTAVTANGTTVNWDDNATNESGFVITRATDAAFTQNVSTTSVVSTTSAGTGTAYSSIQTGLSAGTNYFYRVLAIVEAGQSTGITGNQTTLNGATYYWTGADGGLWNTFSNWNTAADGTGSEPTAWANSDTHIIDGAGTTAGGALSISVDRASFTVGQILITSNTNLTLASSATTTRTITISGGPNEDFILENGSTLNLINATNAVAFNFSGSGNTGTIAGTYIAGGATANTINTTAAGTLLTVTPTGNITSNLNSSTGCITGNSTNLVFENGSNWTHQNSTTINYIPNATWQANATATLNGNTTGTSITSASPILGNLIINNTLSTATLSAFTLNVRTIQGNLTINSTGTGRFRAVTSGLLTINGNLIVNGGIFEVGSASGFVVVKGNTTIASGSTCDLNQGNLNNEGNMINNGTILSSETTTANSRLNFFGTTGQQTFSGSGSFSNRVSSLGVFNPMGLNISTPTLVQRVNLFAGLITGSSFITVGNGLALPGAVQIGQAANTLPGGSFDAAPFYDLGTGTFSLLYLGETTPRTTGFEVPPTRSVNNLTLDNVNGLTIAGGTIEVVNGLTLTNGIVNATLTDHIIHGSTTAAGTLTGGSSSSYVNGPIVRTINDANLATNFNLYPVGKAGVYAPIWLAPTTTAASRFVAEAFDSNTGTADASIIGLSANRRWQAQLATGSFTDINVRLGDANLVSTNIPVHAATASGVYSSAFGSVATFTVGTPNTAQSNNAVASANYNGFLSFANSNACIGTPTPGATTASSTSICDGASTTLGLTSIPVGAGVTYQWQSSTDNVTYSNISAATNNSYVATPTVATWYQCVVTCASGPSSATSTPIQITFTNNVTATTPATRCGTGTVDLEAIPNAGASINWYDTQNGGAPLASGNIFTTPSIAATTTYYASANTSTPSNIFLGAGGTNSSSTAASFLPGFWGGTKTQYIIRASELIQAGLSAGPITNLGFEPTDSGQTYQGFYVNIGQTTAMTAPTTTFIPNTGLTFVYAGTEANDGFTPVANTVNNLVFGSGTGTSSSFIWDGTSNIVVSISWSRVPAASTATPTTMKVDNVGFVSASFRQRDNLTPAAMLGETSVNSTSSNRPRFLINGQVLCSSPRVPVIATVTTPPALTLGSSSVTICEAETSVAVTLTSNVADYNTYTWSPSIGVTGNEATGWSFNPTVSTNYTLTAAQTSGSLCSTTTTFNVTVNSLPSVLNITPSSASICTDAIQSLIVTGGTTGVEGKVGSGTLTNTISTPFKGFWGGSKTQALYTASELTALGMVAGQNINTIGFVALSGTPLVLNNFTINAGFVSNSTLGTNFISGATNVVLAPVNYTPSTNAGNLDFTLTTPLNWDGVSSLLIETCFNNNNGGGISANSISVESSSVASGLILYRSQDNTADVCSNTTSPTSTTTRPNLRISTIEIAAISWSPVTNLFTDPAATVAYVANTNATTVYFKSSTATLNNYTATATTPLGCVRTASTAVTTIDCSIPYANLQFPGTATIGTCNTETFFAQVFKAGVTEPVGQGAGITAWIGTNTTNTDPATWPESSWQLATYNATPLIPNNNDEYQLTVGPLAAGTYYVASRFVFTPGNFVYGGYTATGGGIWDATTNVSAVLTVQTIPAPTANAQTFCNSATVADLVATGTALQWYSTATGGTALTSGTALVSGDYYVSQTINSCESTRTLVNVTVNLTAAPTASAQTFCNGATVADLVATGTALQWYSVATGGTALLASTILASGDYYVSQTLNSCESPRTMVNVTITTASTPTGNALQTITEPLAADATIEDIVVSGTGIIWYATSADALAGTNPIAAGTQLISGNTYYAVSVIGTCRSAALEVTITVVLSANSFDLKQLKYYPNPVLDVFTVSYSKEITSIEVYDLSGRQVKGKKANSTEISIDMSELAASVYVVKVFADNQSSEFRIVKR